MRRNHLRDWLEGIGFAAVIASLIFVGFQIRQERDIAMVETMSHRTDFAVELANLIGENREIWAAGLNDEELSAADRAVYGAIAIALEQHFLYRFTRAIQLGGATPEFIARKYSFRLYQNPSLRDVWLEGGANIKARYQAFDMLQPNDVWRGTIDTQLAELDSHSFPVQPKKSRLVW